jgi:hypothetical protein
MKAVDREIRRAGWHWKTRGAMKSSNDVLLCDFCGNSEHVAALIVRGVADAAICDECIETCTEIVAERRAEKAERGPRIVSVAKAWVVKAIGKR